MRSGLSGKEPDDMRIHTRLRLTTWISLSAMVIMFGAFSWSLWVITCADKAMNISDEMRKLVFERVLLRDDYLLHMEQRAKNQWNAKSEVFQGLLGQADKHFQQPHDKILLQDVRKNFESSFSILTVLLTKHQQAELTVKTALDFSEAEIRLINHEYLMTYVMKDGIDRLYESAHRAATDARNRASLISIIFVIGSMLTIVVNTSVVNRTISKRIADLSHGVGIIGAGNLNHRIAAEGDDELSDLARSSNEMADRLRQSHTSVENLKKEIAAREQADEKLKATQSQILQSDKMASIGQLAAGIAHEINNPVGFVSSNLKTLTDYQMNLGQILSEYRQFIDHLSEAKNTGLIESEIENPTACLRTKETELDIDFILEDIPNLIRESCEGLDRIKQIVLNLKDFSHPGEDILKLADINQNLDTTLNIVWNELKYKATIIKDYGNLPQVNCYPQQINQVFMNLLVNAAHAIEKKGEIRITTRQNGNHVEITVSDTGQGIAAKNLPRIFDPFFTTKAVGKGTGLGLNVSHNIVIKHHGVIDVQSDPGKGTTFTVRLPITGPSSEDIRGSADLIVQGVSDG